MAKRARRHRDSDGEKSEGEQTLDDEFVRGYEDKVHDMITPESARRVKECTIRAELLRHLFGDKLLSNLRGDEMLRPEALDFNLGECDAATQAQIRRWASIVLRVCHARKKQHNRAARGAHERLCEESRIMTQLKADLAKTSCALTQRHFRSFHWDAKYAMQGAENEALEELGQENVAWHLQKVAAHLVKRVDAESARSAQAASDDAHNREKSTPNAAGI